MKAVKAMGLGTPPPKPIGTVGSSTLGRASAQKVIDGRRVARHMDDLEKKGTPEARQLVKDWKTANAAKYGATGVTSDAAVSPDAAQVTGPQQARVLRRVIGEADQREAQIETRMARLEERLVSMPGNPRVLDRLDGLSMQLDALRDLRDDHQTALAKVDYAIRGAEAAAAEAEQAAMKLNLPKAPRRPNAQPGSVRALPQLVSSAMVPKAPRLPNAQAGSVGALPQLVRSALDQVGPARKMAEGASVTVKKAYKRLGSAPPDSELLNQLEALCSQLQIYESLVLEAGDAIKRELVRTNPQQKAQLDASALTLSGCRDAIRTAHWEVTGAIIDLEARLDPE